MPQPASRHTERLAGQKQFGERANRASRTTVRPSGFGLELIESQPKMMN
jgi:hypothetical protein